MKKSLALLLLLAGCNRSEAPADQGNRAAPAVAGRTDAQPATAAAQGRLTGLYEGKAGEQTNQLCMVEKGGETQFGLIVWGANLHSCSGAGRATRSGERLTLSMTGDETCTVDATLKNGTIALPATLPTGCAYYCGARASLANATFDRSGTTEADAKKATDVAGDPLCD